MSFKIDNVEVTILPTPSNGFKTAADEAADTATVAKSARVVRNVFNIISQFPSLGVVKMAKAIGAFAGATGDTFEMLDGILDLKGTFELTEKEKIALNKEDNSTIQLKKGIKGLKITSSIIGIILGPLMGVQILKDLGVFGKASLSVGNCSLGTFYSFGETTRSVVDIATGALTLSLIDKQTKSLEKKHAKWNPVLYTGLKKFVEENKQRIAEYGAELATKKAIYQQKFDELKLKAVTSGKILQNWNQTYLTDKSKKVVNEIKKKAEIHNKAFKDYEAASKKMKKLEDKIVKWEIIQKRFADNDLNIDEKEKIETYVHKKIGKIEAKKINLKWEKVKEGLGVAFNTVLLVALVASLVLTFMGIGVFAAAITLTSVFLFISLFSLGLHLFRKYKKPDPKANISIPVPDLTKKVA